MTQNIREKLASAEIGATVGFTANDAPSPEVFHKVHFALLRKLEAEGRIKITYKEQENVTGHRYIAVVTVKRLL